MLQLLQRLKQPLFQSKKSWKLLGGRHQDALISFMTNLWNPPHLLLLFSRLVSPEIGLVGKVLFTKYYRKRLYFIFMFPNVTLMLCTPAYGVLWFNWYIDCIVTTALLAPFLMIFIVGKILVCSVYACHVNLFRLLLSVNKLTIVTISFTVCSSCDCLGFEISWDPWGSDDEIELKN